jgi:predicted P-loop ATPase
MAGPGSPQLLICHNEGAARAAADLLGMDTASAPDVDWGAIQGHRLILWPANTTLSLLAAKASARAAHAAGAASIKLIEPGELAPAGWDAVAAQVEGWSRDDLLDWLRAHAVVWEPPAAASDQADMPGEYGAVPPEPPPAPDVRTEAEITGGDGPGEPLLPLDRAPSPFDPHAPMADRWAMLGLETTKSGPSANENNAMRVLENHPDLRDLLWFDEFLGRIMTTGPAGAREWTDADDVRLTVSMQRDLGMTRTKVSHVRAAVIGYAFAHVRNCAKEWISGLKWDGIERIHAFFPDSFGTPDTAYARAVGRNFWVSLVARVFRPGCKVDTMVILEGGQGAGKSSVLKAIGGEWFTVQHESITGKGFFEVLQGKMLVEIAEMDAFGKAEVTRVKQVVSTETDRYRESYGRYAKDHPRHSIFVGTTNKDDWNRDETGARRFWPIRCVGAIDLVSVRRNREQLFAEALAALNAGASWWEMPESETLAEQDARRDEDPWAQEVRDWVADIYRTEVTVTDVLRDGLGLRRVEMGKPQQMRVGAILRGFGWTKQHTALGNVWRRPEK